MQNTSIQKIDTAETRSNSYAGLPYKKNQSASAAVIRRHKRDIMSGSAQDSSIKQLSSNIEQMNVQEKPYDTGTFTPQTAQLESINVPPEILQANRIAERIDAQKFGVGQNGGAIRINTAQPTKKRRYLI